MPGISILRSHIIFKLTLMVLMSWGLANNLCCARPVEENNRVLVLCYHDIPRVLDNDPYGVDQKSFVQQVEYLRTHGYNFVSLEDLRRANRRERDLPDKAVLLTFDDGYLSFYEFVQPLLELYGYPSVLAIPSLWFEEQPPKGMTLPLMDWEQLREVAQSDLVEVASHTHSLHRDVQFNSSGNRAWAATSRIYDPVRQQYETGSEYRRRVATDLVYSREVLEARTGVNITAVVWPYGKYNRVLIEEAQRAGFDAMLTLHDDSWASANDLTAVKRYMIEKNPPIETFIKGLKDQFVDTDHQRILHADLDLIYDPDQQQQERNLDIFIERVFSLKVSTVYLQAFADPDGDGTVDSVYFPNRVLPMRADLFNRAANQLEIRGISVYAWMPVLSIELPDAALTQGMRVREMREGRTQLATSWYRRLSPFSSQAEELLFQLYEDLAAHAKISGILFQDDGYLNDYEDFHPQAIPFYREICGGTMMPFTQLNEKQQDAWTDCKTERLITLTQHLQEIVRSYRPYARFARTLYAPVLQSVVNEEWLAQSYVRSLAVYDYVVIMAYPRMEDVRQPLSWLRTLVSLAAEHPDGLRKTVFKVQAYDWENEEWVDSKTIHKWLRALVAVGARHVGYYPDNYLEDQPQAGLLRRMMSVEDFPFKR